MVDEDDDDRKVELTDLRKFSWMVVALIAANTAEDILDNLSSAAGHLRCHLGAAIRYREGNEALIREIRALPEK